MTTANFTVDNRPPELFTSFRAILFLGSYLTRLIYSVCRKRLVVLPWGDYNRLALSSRVSVSNSKAISLIFVIAAHQIHSLTAHESNLSDEGVLPWLR